MTTTTTLRNWWAPACQGPFTRLTLHGGGRVTIRTPIVSAVHALDDCLRVWDYRTRVEDTGAYNCRQITGGTGYSLHAYGIAVDLNWQSNPYGRTLITDMPREMVAAIKALRTKNGKQVWRWGGDYAGSKDAMHFEIVCHPDDIATGISVASLPGRQPPPPEEDEDMTPEQAAKLDAIHMLVTAAARDAAEALEVARFVRDRQVPESTVRADIVLTREIAKKVGVEQ